MHALHMHMHVHIYVCTHARMHPCTNAGVHNGTLHATCQVPVARYAMQPGWMTGVAWSPVGEALLASTDAPAIVLQLLQAPRTPYTARARRTPHAARRTRPVQRAPRVHSCIRAYAVRAFAHVRARAPQGTRVGSASNLAMAGSSTSFGVWALSLSACGGLLAAVSSDGRLEVRRQEAKPRAGRRRVVQARLARARAAS